VRTFYFFSFSFPPLLFYFFLSPNTTNCSTLAVHATNAHAHFKALTPATILFQTCMFLSPSLIPCSFNVWFLVIRRLVAQIHRDELTSKRSRKSRPPPLSSTFSPSSSPFAPPSTPSPRNVSFREPVHTHRGDEDDEVGDRAGTPPLASAHSPHDAARERRERRAEREREKEREKEEKKERERMERLALTDRLSLPTSLTSIPLPPRYE
jgi:hypothetical protein